MKYQDQNRPDALFAVQSIAELSARPGKDLTVIVSAADFKKLWIGRGIQLPDGNLAGVAGLTGNPVFQVVLRPAKPSVDLADTIKAGEEYFLLLPSPV